MKKWTLILLLSSLNVHAQVSITSLNLKWFGIGAELSGKSSDEYRGPRLSEFISSYLKKTNIFVFQEVVDKAQLTEVLNPLNFKCYSYNKRLSKHQYVVVCLDQNYDIMPEENDNNIFFEDIEDVENSKLRPAISGLVIETTSKKPLFHLLGVHLKAGKQEGQIRKIQNELLSKRISSFNDKYPVILTGDFNSYIKEDAIDIEIDDIGSMDEIYQQAGLKRVAHNYRYTYKSFNYGYLFDHFYVSKNLNFSKINVFSACNFSNSSSQRFENINFYNRFISDHCPITLDIQ